MEKNQTYNMMPKMRNLSQEIPKTKQIELSFSFEKKRLDKMKKVLGEGSLVNQSKIQNAIGEDFDESKQKHQELISKQLRSL